MMKRTALIRIVTFVVALCVFATTLAGIFARAESELLPVFSHEGGIYEQAFELEIEGGGNRVYYTLDGSVPDETAQLYDGKIAIAPKKLSPRTVQGRVAQQRTEKGIVVRAIAYDKEGNASEVVTNTYFVSENVAKIAENVPVIAISAAPKDLWDKKDGIYTNYEEERKIDAYVECFDNSGEGFERNLQIKVSGHGSRSNAKKSIRLYFTKGDTAGRKNLEYDLIKGTEKNFYNSDEVEKYGKVTFRISDWTDTDIKDPMAQKIAEFTRVDTANSNPAALFLNGEFWGIYEMREQYDNRYLDYHYEGIDKDDVVFLDRDWTNENVNYTLSDNGYSSVDRITYEEGPEEDEEYYTDQFYYVNYLMKNAENEAMYREMEALVDVDNLIDYLFVYLYTDNIDWPGNNFKFWRTTVERSNNDVYAADGKWRFMVHDFDLAFDNAENNTMEYALKSDLPQTEARHPAFATESIEGLFRNEKFRNRFAQRAAAYLSTAVEKENFEKIVDEMIGEREGVKAFDLLRWNNMSGSSSERLEAWKASTRNKYVGFAEKRNRYFEKMIADFYKKYYNSQIGETTSFEFEADADTMSVDIDGAVVRKSFYGDKAKSFTTKQYVGIPLEITAECRDGYVVKTIVINGERFEGDRVVIVPEAKSYSVSFETVEGLKSEKVPSETVVVRKERFLKMKTGEKLPVELVAVYDDGTSERVYGFDTDVAVYGCDENENAEVICVSDNAVLTAKSAGSAIVTVAYKGAFTTFNVTVE